ncbi:MAG: Bipolar DNA helicase HerA [Ktedonobacterales bacterium]|nr:MAG: Bipolar DNA helicase HerA [Ktedonobacterales bacterium]
MQEERWLGTLVGDTGGLRVNVALRDSFSARRGEFVRVRHRERRDTHETWVLGRITGVSRQNMLFTQQMGEGVAEVSLLTSRSTGETNYAGMELVGYRDPDTGEVRIPRRPLEPGAKVYGVDFAFLREFYEYSPETNIQLGNLVGYERGDNIVPVYIDVNRIVTEHLAVLAMTGAGKSYTIGRIIERMLTESNASIVVLDPHGEYGRAFRGGMLNFAPDSTYAALPEQEADGLRALGAKLRELQDRGGGIHVYAPRTREFSLRYNDQHHPLALRLDEMSADELASVFPESTEPQQRFLQVALRYWEKKFPSPREPRDLLDLCGRNLDALTTWDELPDNERKTISARSASIVALRLRNLLTDANAFYERGLHPFDVRQMIGRARKTAPADSVGRISIIDLQGLSRTSMQVVVALLCGEILRAAQDTSDPIRPVFLIIEEGHTFAPAREASISLPIIKKIFAEGRKFGVGAAIVSQRPSKLDSDVTSQANTIIAMRIKNPDDQAFIRSTSDYFSEVDIKELPSLSTGEALVSGRAILAPLLVKVGQKVLIHGGESPDVVRSWKE